jgi:integrase
MRALTKRTIDAAKPGPRDYFLWCKATTGFGIRVHPSGKKVFVAQVRVAREQRRVKLGLYGPFTVEQARKKAEDVIRGAANGRDPQQTRREARAALSVAELCDLYLTAAKAGLVMTRFRIPKRQSTVKIDEGRIARHIKPLIGQIAAPSLGRADVQRMADDIASGKTAGVFSSDKKRGRAVVSGGTTTAARVVELLGGIFSWADKRGLVSGVNPTRGVETAKGQPRDRVLTPPELSKLGAVLRDNEPSQPAAAVRLIAMTGFRREEACSLRWRDLDVSGSCVRLQNTKTGRSVRPVGRAVLALLESIRSDASEWVFPNRNDTGSADLKKSIAALFEEAGLADARSHDLRRTFGSTAADLGYSDATIGELLGHARRGVTSRHYIRRPDAALVEAADRVCEHILANLSGAPPATVIPIRKETADAIK